MKEELTEFIQKYHQNVHKTEFFKEKGFSYNIISKYKLAFSEDGFNTMIRELSFIEHSESSIMKCYQIFIPIFDETGMVEYILVRRVNNDKTISKTLMYNGISVEIFNARYIKNRSLLNGSKLLFITESWTDALSIEELGYRAISLNGLSNSEKLVDLIYINKDNMKNTMLVCACDRDEKGQKANISLYKAIGNFHNKITIYSDMPDTYKDFNEWLLGDRADMSKALKKFYTEIYNIL